MDRAARRKEVWGCQRCGSERLRMPGFGDGVMVGEAQDLARMACDECGLVAVAFTFDDEAARSAYATERAKHPSVDWPASGWIDKDGLQRWGQRIKDRKAGQKAKR